MTVWGRISKIAVLGVGMTMLVACSETIRTHGYTPNESDLQNVIVGVDTQATLEDTIGTPTTTGVLQDSDWYYVESEWRHYAWKAPREVSREVLAIRFDANGVVENIERFGLQDGQVVILSRRVTDSNVRGIGFLRQLLGNVGNFTADQLFDN